jgi:hypothetical protein
VPGKSPEEAIDAFTGFISETLSCVTRDCLTGFQASDHRHKIFFSDPAAVRSAAGETFYLSIVQTFTTVKKQDDGLYKVRTLQYSYVFNDDPQPTNKGLVSYHWHPDDFSLRDPHLHLHITPEVGYPEIERRIARAHFPTSRVCLEDFIILLIKYYDIIPVVSETKWKRILKKNKAAFSKMATWAVKPN